MQIKVQSEQTRKPKTFTSRDEALEYSRELWRNGDSGIIFDPPLSQLQE
jgi:hypothetical protein